MDDALPDPPPVYHTTERPPFDVHDPPQQPPPECVDPTLWSVAVELHRAHRPGVDGWCACRLFHPCPAWWRAVAALGAACAALTGGPRLFALCDAAGAVLGYGMALPDGSAVTAQWRAGTRGPVVVWSSPVEPARLWSCSLVWLSRVPAGGG
ncbi:MAG TPA: hypothetical protein VNV66_06835 [Pilimelia sp.]|nr:hypothetical protein [Pilimelia sp.]